MRTIFVLSMLFLYSIAGTSQHVLETKPVASHVDGIKAYQHLSLDGQRIMESPSRGSVYQFSIGHKDYYFDLIETQLKSVDYTVVAADGQAVEPTTAKTYTGFVHGGGVVSLTVNTNFTYGYFEVDQNTYYIEPAWYHLEEERSSNVIVYSTKDVIDFSVPCAYNETQRIERTNAASRSESRQLGECYEVDLAIASDYLMFQKYGSVMDVEDHNIGVANNVQTLFTGEFDDDIEFNIVTQFVSNCSTCDPWTSSTDPSTLLQSFTNWGGNGFGVDHDLGNLWTDRDLDGSTIGLAWVASLCSNFQYSLFEDFTANATFLQILVAHETGHSFDAEHDAAGSPYIMAPVIQNTSDWSDLSITDISDFIDNVTSASWNCLSDCPASGPPIANFNYSIESVCEGTQVHFYDKSILATDYNWTFAGGTPASSTAQNPVVTYNSPGIYNVQLQVSNTAGNDVLQINGAVEVSATGSAVLLYDAFDSGLSQWTVSNPDNQIGWETVDVGGNFTGSGAAVLENINYNSTGQMDALISPTIDMIGYTEASLDINYAYVRAINVSTDSLIIRVSIDGGTSYEQVYSIGEFNGNFSTASNRNTAFVPSVTNDWCGSSTNCLSVDLSDFAGEQNVRIAIVNRTNSSNNLYIDQVMLRTDCYELNPPIALFEANPTTGCVPLEVQFTDLSDDSPQTWFWTLDGASPSSSNLRNPQVVYNTAGVYDVGLEVSNAAGSDFIQENNYIQVLDLPSGYFTSNADGLEVEFFPSVTGATGYLWNFGDGFTSMTENPTHTYAADGDYDVSLIVSNICGSHTIDTMIAVNSSVNASANLTETTICSGDAVMFNNTSSSNATDFQWFFDGGVPASSQDFSPTVSYNNTGFYTVTLIASNALFSDTLVLANYVTVIDQPQASFTATPNGGLSLSFDYTGTAATTVDWDFGDGNNATGASVNYTYGSFGNYTVQCTATNACGEDVVSQNITVGTVPFADFNSDKQTVCINDIIQYSVANPMSGENYLWTFIGGSPASSTDPVVDVSYSMEGNYGVQLIVSNAIGSDTITQNNYVTVKEGPTGSITYNQNSGTTYEFNFNGSNFDQVLWDFGDGAMDQGTSVAHTYADEGFYTVLVTVSNACDSKVYEVQLEVKEGYSAEFTAEIVEGCSPLVVQFNTVQNTQNLVHRWVFEGGNPSTSSLLAPIVTFENAGTFDVQLEISGLTGTDLVEKSDYITVFESPQALFTIVSGTDGDKTNNMSVGATNYAWFIQDSLYSTEPDIDLPTINGNASYELILIAYNANCSDTTTLDYTVNLTQVELEELGIKVYPNPVVETFVFETSQADKIHELNLFNAQGKLIRTIPVLNTKTYISLASDPSGLYFVQMHSDIGSASFSLMKK